MAQVYGPWVRGPAITDENSAMPTNYGFSYSVSSYTKSGATRAAAAAATTLFYSIVDAPSATAFDLVDAGFGANGFNMKAGDYRQVGHWQLGGSFVDEASPNGTTRFGYAIMRCDFFYGLHAQATNRVSSPPAPPGSTRIGFQTPLGEHFNAGGSAILGTPSGAVPAVPIDNAAYIAPTIEALSVEASLLKYSSGGGSGVGSEVAHHVAVLPAGRATTRGTVAGRKNIYNRPIVELTHTFSLPSLATPLTGAELAALTPIATIEPFNLNPTEVSPYSGLPSLPTTTFRFDYVSIPIPVDLALAGPVDIVFYPEPMTTLAAVNARAQMAVVSSYPWVTYRPNMLTRVLYEPLWNITTGPGNAKARFKGIRPHFV